MIVDPRLYSKEYFLTDNEGWREYSGDLDKRVHAKFKKALDLMNPSRGDSVLDIGCGRGELVYYCAKRGSRASGIDYSTSAIELAKETMRRLPKETRHLARVELVDGTSFCFSSKYDIIFMIDVVEHMYDWQLVEMLKNINQVLNDGGRIYISTPNYYYEKYLMPIKRIVNIPWNLIKWPVRVLKGKYRPKNFSELLKKIFKVKVDRGPLNRMMHVNVTTPARLKKILGDFDTKVYCNDHSRNPLSLLMRRWWGRDQVIIASKLRDVGSNPLKIA